MKSAEKASRPARNRSPSRLRDPSGRPRTLRPSLRIDRWMWQPEPTSLDGLAMNVTEQPICCAVALTASLYSMCASAARSGSE